MEVPCGPKYRALAPPSDAACTVLESTIPASAQRQLSSVPSLEPARTFSCFRGDTKRPVTATRSPDEDWPGVVMSKESQAA
jgi:hypothetical protein